MTAEPTLGRAPTAAMKAEQALVAQARAGDAGAFRELVERYEGLVAATVIGMLGRGPEAEDVGQEVFVRFYRALGQYRGEGGVAAYLTRIATNLSLSALERRRRARPHEPPPEALPDPAAAAGIDAREAHEVVHAALARLDDAHRAVVVLRLIDGRSTRETAELLGIPVGTVLSRLSRAQARLRNILAHYL